MFAEINVAYLLTQGEIKMTIKIKFSKLQLHFFSMFVWMDKDGDRVQWEPFEDWPESMVQDLARDLASHTESLLKELKVEVIH